MALVELQYEERADGLMYPILDIGEKELNNLGKFAKARLEYLHSKKFDRYRELLLTGKLAQHCEVFETCADDMYEQLFQKYLAENLPTNDDNFVDRLAVFEQANKWAEEIVLAEIIHV